VPHQLIWSLYTGCWCNIWYSAKGFWEAPQPAPASPRCTKCNNTPINSQCTSHHIAV